MPPSPSPRSRGPKPTRVDPDQLLDAAQDVFAECGLQAATLRAIARRAGCDPALIYYHFESKEALFTALLDRRFPRVEADMAALADASHRGTAERLWDVLRIYHRHLNRDPGLRAMVRGEIVRGAGGIGKLIEHRIRPVVQLVHRIVAEGVGRGDLRPELDPQLATFFLLKMQLEILDVLPVMAQGVLGLPSESAVPRGMRAWFELYWRGVARDPGLPLPALPDGDA